MEFQLLIAEDDAGMAQLLTELAREAGFAVSHYSSGDQARDALLAEPPDALLADLRMPGLTGTELIEAAAASHPGMPAAIITGYATVPDVVHAFRAGAIDLITKPFDNNDVRGVLQRFRHQLERERRSEALAARLERLEASAPPLQPQSRAMQAATELVAKVAALDTPVLLTGETGSGKGVLARAIHDCSERHDGPWFSVNCGALADSVAESELFGHERGAFTGANSRKRGVLELADGGTLFLDEINSASPAVQTRLLEFSQQRSLRRVGGEQTFSVDVRLVVASNQDLAQAVADGSFREDLWYRLNVFPIQVPPLRQRRDDILPLAEHFLASAALHLNRPARRFADNAEQAMLAYAWPGNVRELENCVHRAVILADGEQVAPQHLPPGLAANPAPAAAPRWRPDATLAEVEQQWIQHMLSRCADNKSEAARRLGIDVSTLHRKLRAGPKY